MLVLVIFAFLAGVFTILSPCILPILPAVLSGGVSKGAWRPFGIVLGLIVSFTFFTLALTAIVRATGISPNILRYIAIALIFAFGLIMIFPSLSDRFAKWVAPVAAVGQQIQTRDTGTGFGGGFILGIALGLLWTPCAGPILAAITTVVATQSVTFPIIIITLAYSLGAGVPLFLIAYGGSRIIQSSRYLSKHAEGLRQIFGILMILTAISIALHWDMLLQQQVTRFVPPILVEDIPVVKSQLDRLNTEQPLESAPTEKSGDSIKAPEITGIVNWINSPPLSLEQLRGKVVLVDFWTYSCINCLRTLPYIEKWYADYKDKGLVVIGVHTPEFEFEKDPQNVAEAAARLGILYPIAQDNDYKTWKAFHNHYWPAHYLIDQDGNLAMVHFGEGGYVKTENAIRKLLGMAALKMQEPQHRIRALSPETYLGTLRSESYTPEIHLKSEVAARYEYNRPLASNQVGLKGEWKVEGERITSLSDSSYLDMNFTAKRVYLVLSGSSAVPIEVFLDGAPYGEVKMDGDRKYDIVDVTYGKHLLSLKIPSGVSAYAFTFGDE